MPDDGLDFGYDSYLSQVPEAIRSQIEPAFKSYSENLQNSYKTEHEAFSPYREFEDQGWTPDHVGLGLNILNELNNNPRRIFDALVENNPEFLQHVQQQQTGNQLQQQFQQQQQQNQLPFPNNNQQQNNWDTGLPPELVERMNQQEQIINLMFQGFQQDREWRQQQEAQSQESKELQQFEAELDKIAPKDKYPRDFIYAYVAQGKTPQEAVKSYTDWYTAEQAKWRGNGAPLVAPGSGGGSVHEPVDTSKLSDTARKDLIVQYLNAANQQAG